MKSVEAAHAAEADWISAAFVVDGEKAIVHKYKGRSKVRMSLIVSVGRDCSQERSEAGAANFLRVYE
jgi:hypothetical protein